MDGNNVRSALDDPATDRWTLLPGDYDIDINPTWVDDDLAPWPSGADAGPTATRPGYFPVP